MNKFERTILQCLGGAIIVIVMDSFLINYFTHLDFEGNWEGDNSSVSFFPQKFQSPFYMSEGNVFEQGTISNANNSSENYLPFIAIDAPPFFVDYFDSLHDWPKNLAKTCVENKQIVITFTSYSRELFTTQLPISEKYETFTIKREIVGSPPQFSIGVNEMWWSSQEFIIEGIYHSNGIGGDSTVYFCNTTKLLQEKILFGLLNYDDLTIRVENADSFVVDGSYRIASYPTNKIKESDLQLFKENL